MEDFDRVQENTEESVNQDLMSEADARIRMSRSASKEEITARIHELDKEWDIERALEMNASLFAFSGLALGVVHNRKWLAVPAVVLPFLFQHAVQGWCPPLPILRRLGFRTRKEIDREKYALKAFRGDLREAVPEASTNEVLNAVDA
ncbi:MAG: hypothetical protein PSX80_16740 [bacterium]|nr:hypothetical protein [bacterium]